MSRTSAQEPDYQMFAPISKVDVQQRMVFGYASTETEDRQGEIVRHSAVKAALPGYMLWKNVREMHQPSAVGKAVEAEMDEKGLWFGAHIVDDRAWEKVLKKVYQGFSIGGRVTARDPNNKKIITGVDITEISIVDRPANPEATFAFAKRAGDHLLMQPVQKWDCGHPDHQHITKLEAATCMADHQELMKASFDRAEDIDTLAKMNDKHHPAGSEKGGQFAPKDGGDGADADPHKASREAEVKDFEDRMARNRAASPEEKAAKQKRIDAFLARERARVELEQAQKKKTGKNRRPKNVSASDWDAGETEESVTGMKKVDAIYQRIAELRKMNDNHHPAGTEKGGEFAPKDGGDAGGSTPQSSMATKAGEDDDLYDGKPYKVTPNDDDDEAAANDEGTTTDGTGGIRSKSSEDIVKEQVGDQVGSKGRKPDTSDRAQKDFAFHEGKENFHLEAAAKEKDPVKRKAHNDAADAHAEAKNYYESAAKNKKSGKAGHAAGDADAGNEKGAAANKLSEALEKGDKLDILHAQADLRKYNKSHWPAGSPGGKGGQFAPKTGGEDGFADHQEAVRQLNNRARESRAAKGRDDRQKNRVLQAFADKTSRIDDYDIKHIGNYQWKVTRKADHQTHYVPFAATAAGAFRAAKRPTS